LALFDGATLEQRVAGLLSGAGRDAERTTVGVLGIVSLVLLAGCLAFLPVPVLVPPGSGGAPLHDFAGRWEGRFRDRPFLTLTLAERDDALAGSVSRTRFLVDGDGELLAAEERGPRDAVTAVRVGSAELLVVSTAPGRIGNGIEPPFTVSVRYTMRLTGADAAEVQLTGTPPGVPPPKPWPLRRAVPGW
jgi:hypothetical protein